MSFFNSVLANSVGVLWRAGTGTVDPWTKANIVEQNAAGIVQASGGVTPMGSGVDGGVGGVSTTDGTVYGTVVDPAQAQQIAQNDADATLSSVGADPSQWASQMANSFGRAINFFSGKNQNLLDPNQPKVDWFSVSMWGLVLVAIVVFFFSLGRSIFK